MRIKGVIFDMDGLILDTEKLYQRFWIEAARLCGFEMSKEMVLKLRSLDRELAKGLFKEYFGNHCYYEQVKKKRVELMSDYVDKHGIEAKKGVRELVLYLRKKGYKTAVATATNYKRASEHLSIAGVRDCFDNIICAADVDHGKPFPDVYLYACRQLGLMPEECIALEDSPNGVRSAYAAGCKVICIPDTDELEDEIKPFLFDSADSLLGVIDIINSFN